ncbi:glycosyltransferase family 4 protein [Paenibacillus elgii]|uniref:glycosyltransferase family 4 protein n=2 Tax=Paenibacillus elgii TaxID=189691 RepID=UPI0013E2F133|nr:glycosyltransferase family 4 protein [Paenibacillus elgii]
MKIKICHISEATSGGVLTHLTQLAENLDADVFEQSFILSSKKNSTLSQTNSFLGHPLFIVDMARTISPWADLQSLFQIIKILKTNKFDIIHCHSSKAGVLGRMAAYMTGCKIIYYTPHSFSFNIFNSKLKNAIYAFIEKIMTLFTTKVICVSAGEFYLALQMKVSNEKKMVVIPNGVELKKKGMTREKKNLLEIKGITYSKKVIGFVGRLSIQKNPEMIVRAIEKIKMDDVLLLIMGTGPLEKSLTELVNLLGVSDKILFLGEISNVREVLGYCNIFVSTSLWESMPYAILEAMEEEIPVIATEISGVTDIVKNNITGILVPPNDYERLASIIEELLPDSDKQKKLTQNAKEIINQEYNIENMIEKLKNLYLSAP